MNINSKATPKKKGPCLGCTKRSAGVDEDGKVFNCHSTCKEYIEHTEKQNQRKDMIYAEKKKYLDQTGFVIAQKQKANRKHGYKKQR